jgi:DNA-binding NarL/FixJ family response regulator
MRSLFWPQLAKSKRVTIVKILVVDDHALILEGLCQVLKGLDEQVEVLQAGDCAHAFQIANHHPDLDLVLLDYHLPDMTGLEALGLLSKSHPELPVVILSGSYDLQIVHQVMKSGAAGFIPKSCVSTELLLALRRVLAGEIYYPSELMLSLAPPTMGQADDELPTFPLTPRQEVVLRLLMYGLTNKEISRILDLSAETTKNHVTAVLRHFAVKTRVQAVIAASDQGYSKSGLSL